MRNMEHWHPVALSAELGTKPIGVRLNGEEIALFRTVRGEIGALQDQCPHRRMRLSCGAVRGDRLECPYHGWTFDCSGAGESPGTPKLHAQAKHYEVREQYGAVWIRRAGGETAFPEFEVAGYHPACVLRHVASAPLEVVLDNFTEIEHTPTTHALLGYELAHMPEVTTAVESTEDSVYVFNRGPQKRIPLYFRALLGVREGDMFVDEWTTRFSPVYSVYDQWWSDPKTGKERRDRLRIYVFFNPIGPEETGLVTFAFLKSRLWSGGAVRAIVGPVLRKLVDMEVGLDVQMLSRLADKTPGIEGMRLSRFDKVLGLNRKRIATVYRGERDETIDTPALPH
ncbi:MAG: aromatic ring-hydroxylating dioxygenase subunit alpha [Candidatus Hydrogenedentes bacterium]|nr:aromatic ring-hydroxylating dioxygenase subunit alpha [Candidatus Hydrogenedentota bacterium]